MERLELLRSFYAEELQAVAGLRSTALVQAFAKVPREHYLGDGPWLLRSPSYEGYRQTPDADPRRLYHNVLVAIDAKRDLNNARPSFLAALIEEVGGAEGQHLVHVGCATGYYSAVMAELVGPRGKVTAIEFDPDLAQRARHNLRTFPHVRVLQGDGSAIDPGPTHGIIVNAGATHPSRHWLNALVMGGVLALPLTVAPDAPGLRRGGHILKVTRQQAGYAACFVSPVGIYPCAASRDPERNLRLHQAFATKDPGQVRSLRCDVHASEESCWLHDSDVCLSTLPVA
jgi:protein-L-isoaspartate(D-aspartate) O-methyltransferase